MTPATAFTKAVCERASKDGWQLEFNSVSFAWERGDVTHRELLATGLGLDARYDLWQACVYLQSKEYPDLQVTID